VLLLFLFAVSVAIGSNRDILPMRLTRHTYVSRPTHSIPFPSCLPTNIVRRQLCPPNLWHQWMPAPSPRRTSHGG
jgi:hypothetical protein